MKGKKIMVIVTTIVLLVVGIVLGLLYFKKENKVVSVITMDINPSIKLSLNYKNHVIKAEGLNSDGKDIINSENFKGDDLSDVIQEITEIVIEKGYIKEDDNHILINVEGKDVKKEVETLIKKEFKEENTECNVIFQEINETAKENAAKYGISDSKASYIEEIIKENEKLTFEDLKDKTINEINNLLENKEEEKEEEKEEDNKEEPKPETSKPNNNNNNSGSSNSGGNNQSSSKPETKPSVSYIPPAIEDRSGAWCDFYASLPPNLELELDQPGRIDDTKVYVEEAKKHLPEDANWSSYFSSVTSYRTATYCTAGVVELENYDKTKTYKMYLDSVTLEVLEFTTKELEKPNIDEAAAVSIVTTFLQTKYGVDINDCSHQNYYYAIDGSTKIPEWQFSCRIDATGVFYAVVVSARDGSIKQSWTN